MEDAGMEDTGDKPEKAGGRQVKTLIYGVSGCDSTENPPSWEAGR